MRMIPMAKGVEAQPLTVKELSSLGGRFFTCKNLELVNGVRSEFHDKRDSISNDAKLKHG